MNSDLKTAIMQLRLYLEGQTKRLLTRKCYGRRRHLWRRITDKQDKITNKCLLNNFFRPEALRDGYQMCGSASYIMPSGESSLADVRNMILLSRFRNAKFRNARMLV